MKITLPRALMAGIALAIAAFACSNELNEPAASPPTVEAVAAPRLLSANVTMAPGRGFGPYGYWADGDSPEANTSPFTGSRQGVDASYIITRINAARARGHHLVLALTGGASSNYKTNGKFDMAKWKKKQATFNTATIRNAIAAAVNDGTVVGYVLIDEPERLDWGYKIVDGKKVSVITKAMMDEMAAYSHSMFPTLPVGPGYGPPGYKNFDPAHTYSKVDFIYAQYNWNVQTKNVYKSGDVAGWLKAVSAQAQKDGVALATGLNIMDGGIRDNDGDSKWECPQPLTEGQGTYAPNCRMTAAQVRTWGKAVAPAGCFILMWRYDSDYMRRSDNQDAFKDVAAYAKTLGTKSCKRPS